MLCYPDAAYKNNPDGSSQRGQTIFLAEQRKTVKPQPIDKAVTHSRVVPRAADSKGSLIDYESTKIKRTTLSTTVSELYAFMKAYGTGLFLRGLWMDLSGDDLELHMRTDANNLVTTAKTTHLPEQKETIHMIQMLRQETCSGNIDDMAHVISEDCLADCLTKQSAKADALLKAIDTGILPQADCHPPFRTLLKHKAYLAAWITRNISYATSVCYFLGEPVDLWSYYSCRE
jgi:hypothetical protein